MEYQTMMVANTVASTATTVLNLPSSITTLISMFILHYGKSYVFAWWHLVFTATIFIIYNIYKYHGEIKSLLWRQGKSQESSKVTLQHETSVKLLSNYIELYPDYFTSNIHYSLDLAGNGDRVLSLNENQTIHFNDSSTNVEGQIIVSSHKEERTIEEKCVTYTTICPTLIILKGNMTAPAYYAYLCERLSQSSMTEKLYYYKVFGEMSNQCVTNVMKEYNIKNEISFQGLEKQYMGTFFSHQKEYLIDLVKKISYEQSFFEEVGQAGTMNLLLHGPPGTGKSSFVYRLAMILKRHIVSIDLSKINSLSYIYNIMNGYNGHSADSIIYLFEEFDQTVFLLDERENNDKTKDKFRTGNLLEILQGPVPIKGRIVIATTNHFEEMSQNHEALFRPGRLTPIYFGYLNSDQVNKLSEIYFGVSAGITYNPEIATSEIVNIAIKARLSGGVALFKDELRRVSHK